MGLNMKRLDRSKQAVNSGSGGGFMRLQNKRNILRIFTFPHKVTKNDFTRGFYSKTDKIKLGEEFDELERAVPRHFTDEGIVNCVVTDCDHCKTAAKLLGSSNKNDQKLGKRLKANTAFYVNVMDLENKDAGLQICALPPIVFNEILTYVLDPEYGEGILGGEGRDFLIDRDTSKPPAKMYNVKLRDEKRCKPIDEEGLEPADLFEVPALEPGWSVVDGLDESEKPDKDEELEDEEPEEKDEGLEDEEPEEKDEEPEDVLPWELPAWCKAGNTVSFDDGDGNTLKGKLVEFDAGKDEFDVDVDGDVWSLKFEELKHVPTGKKKSTKKVVKKAKKTPNRGK